MSVLSLQYGSYTIFLSTKGKNRDDVPQELVSFLEYVANPGNLLSDDYTKHLDNRIATIKRDRIWEAKYMLFEEMLRDEREEGKEAGREEIFVIFQSSILDLLRDIGEVPEDICLRITNEKNGTILKKMMQSAARAKSFDDFRKQV